LDPINRRGPIQTTTSQLLIALSRLQDLVKKANRVFDFQHLVSRIPKDVCLLNLACRRRRLRRPRSDGSNGRTRQAGGNAKSSFDVGTKKARGGQERSAATLRANGSSSSRAGSRVEELTTLSPLMADFGAFVANDFVT
jgi:hypothetical protein